MKRLIVFSALVTVAACSSKPVPSNNRDTMTQRQKDSVFGVSGLPGATAIGKAQAAADTLNAQRKRTDSAMAKADSGTD